MTEALQIAIFSAIFNGAVTWGIISTKLQWLRRDVDSLIKRMNQHENFDRRRPQHQRQDEDTDLAPLN